MAEEAEIHGPNLGRRLRAIAADPSSMNATPRYLAGIAAEAAVRVDNLNPSLLIAMEWGFKANEKGKNLQQALAEFKELLHGEG